ncbi:MAG: sulfatase-like hydrolase/transferase [Lachnospiraceae bacterium]|nr:sulfatase-like hydrolase/transferase [Lachnospiraceae bacterium]
MSIRWKKSNWNRQRVVLALFCLVCMFVTGIRRQNFKGEETETSIGWDLTNGPMENLELDADTELTQVFYAQDGILDLIYIGVDGHGQTGSMIVTVRDASGKEIAVRELPCNTMIDQGAQGIGIYTRVKKGEQYSYTITFQGITDSYPVIQTAKCLTKKELGDFSVNGVKQPFKIYGLFVYQSHYTQCAAWWICVGVTLLMLLYLLLYPLLPVWHTRLLPLFMAAHAVLGVFLLEFVVGTSFELLGFRNFALNVLLCMIGYVALSLVIWRGGVLLKLGTVICCVLGIAEYYVLEFRGLPIVLTDVLSIGTAADVSDAYAFDITPEMIAAVLLMLSVFLLESKIRFTKYSLRLRGAVSGVLVALSVLGVVYLNSLPLMKTEKDGSFFWNLPKSYQENGYFLSSYIYQKFQVVQKPEHYSEQAVQNLMAELEETEHAVSGSADAVMVSADAVEAETEAADDVAAEADQEQKLPNIIAIMNESWTDFASVGGIETSEPVTPFIDSLTENTIRGELYVSVFGSGTANSEFEFLTGSSMRFLPNGSIPYQAYIEQKTPSLASYLKQYGYFTLASHFANRSNWKRDTVYPLLGFDEFLSEPSVEEFECEHGRISDWANYQEVIKRYEQWKEEQTTEHFFCFNVTFQNHGGYLTGYRCENPPHYTGGAADPDVEEYLSTVHVSDQAFQKLVEYFEQEEEPTVIVMFGDHWPRLNNEFLDAITDQDTSAGELEKSQDRYETPYLIWANYDIDAEEGGKLSANYLSTLLLETAGVPLNSYYSFLDGLSKELPVMNSIGYIDAEGDYIGSETELDEKTQADLSDYELLQYELLFGKKDESKAFFDAAVK